MTCRVRVSRVVVGVVVAVSLGCASGLDPAPAPDLEDETGVEVSAPADETPVTDPDPGSDKRTATLSSGYTATRYPIVLAHGMSGWKELFGVLDYFYGIPSELRSSGAKVYVTSVSAFASSEARGEQLLAQVEYIAAASGAGKVNLIGHSQGGLDIRYVAAVRPDLVASVTTVGTPHEGARLADWFLDHTTEGGFSQTVLEVLGSAVGFAIDLLAGTDNPQEVIAALKQVSTAGQDVFNSRYPKGLPSKYCGSGPESSGGIRYYSWSGGSPLTNILDPSDAPFAITRLLAGSGNDGLVDRCSSHFGRVLRDDYWMNHLDEVNQILGLTSLFETSPKTVFRAHANRLKTAGL